MLLYRYLLLFCYYFVTHYANMTNKNSEHSESTSASCHKSIFLLQTWAQLRVCNARAHENKKSTKNEISAATRINLESSCFFDSDLHIINQAEFRFKFIWFLGTWVALTDCAFYQFVLSIMKFTLGCISNDSTDSSVLF